MRRPTPMTYLRDEVKKRNQQAKLPTKKGILSKRSTPQLRGSSETCRLKGHVITTQLKGNFNTMLHTLLLLRGNLSTSNRKQQLPRSAIAVHVVWTSIRVDKGYVLTVSCIKWIYIFCLVSRF